MADESFIPTVDFTDSIELGPIEPGLYGFQISKWQYGTGPSGDPKVDVACDVVRPEGVPGKVFDSINLKNEYTKPRARKIMLITGMISQEDGEKNKAFSMPATGDMLGRQFSARVKTVEQEGYPDKSVFTTMFAIAEYDALAAKT